MDITQAIYDFFSSFYTSIADACWYVLYYFLDGLILVIGYSLFYIYDGFLSVISTVLSLFDVSTSMFDIIGYITGLPPAMIYLISQAGIPEGLMMISAAYIVRILLNLIPAALTRV